MLYSPVLGDALGLTWWTLLAFGAGLAIGATVLKPILGWVLSFAPWNKKG